MKVTKSDRGFEFINLPTHANTPVDACLVSQSSAIGDYDDSWDRPGSSYLWVGEHHHLDREQVAEFVTRLNSWRATGSLEPPTAPPAIVEAGAG